MIFKLVVSIRLTLFSYFLLYTIINCLLVDKTFVWNLLCDLHLFRLFCLVLSMLVDVATTVCS